MWLQKVEDCLCYEITRIDNKKKQNKKTQIYVKNSKRKNSQAKEKKIITLKTMHHITHIYKASLK